ncbi:hypothetical protein AMS68_005350 [Peltaster fructicola]|uniref:t-SNARE coiled-coil homology domain-containing protein n=1 Tax=Peltaster fructicola TaxID=286661 RepID=A0A6H0XYK3_9PEZI|nr:hypothetical protein AMS68_005350 [Peltaster fructicola]
MSASSHQLLLLADHLKLSLLERQRAIALKLDSTKENAQIERSLRSLQEGIESLAAQDVDLDQPEDEASEVPRLRQQYDQLYAQYHGTAVPAMNMRQPNDPGLNDDFAAAQKQPARNRNVRFRDNPEEEEDAGTIANRAALFSDQERYRDEPEALDQSQLSNQQIHEYHTQVIRDQDEQLEVLGQSIGRQRMLGIQMGSEIEEQNEMLGDVESGMTRHQSLLDRAGNRLAHVARKSKANWSWITIAILICILILVIVITK